MQFKDLKNRLNEARGDEMSPAPMLVLRRRGFRLFPDGRRVALYTNDKYKLVFTIPYDAKSSEQTLVPGVRTEEAKPEKKKDQKGSALKDFLKGMHQVLSGDSTQVSRSKKKPK